MQIRSQALRWTLCSENYSAKDCWPLELASELMTIECSSTTIDKHEINQVSVENKQGKQWNETRNKIELNYN